MFAIGWQVGSTPRERLEVAAATMLSRWEDTDPLRGAGWPGQGWTAQLS